MISSQICLFKLTEMETDGREEDKARPHHEALVKQNEDIVAEYF